MNPQPLISIIIPAYNRKDKVLEGIKSAIDQTYANTEILVIDDGSTDGTCEYLESLNLPIQVLRKENGGVSSARNFGILHAKGKYVAFLDSDDLWEPTKLAEQMDYLATNPNTHAVYTDQYLKINGQNLPQTRFQRSAPQSKMIYPAFVDHTPIHSSTVLVEKRILDEVGIFDESLKIHEDSELWNRISNTYDFGYIEKPLSTYVWNSNSDNLTDEPNKEKFCKYGRIYLDLYIKNKNRELTADELEAVDKSIKIIEEKEKSIR